MRPLIKWAGGKSNEIRYIEHILPKFDRYIEPFFGGGALFFELCPNKAVINDISEELITFYKLIQNDRQREKFKKELMLYVTSWERIEKYMSHFGNEFISLYKEYRNNRMDEKELTEEVDALFDKKLIPFNGLFLENFCIDRSNLLKRIKQNLIEKLVRTKTKVDIKNNFSVNDMKKNVETAFRSGFYLHFRDIMNRAKTREVKLSDEKRIANYYFIREFCYGGMFRFNRSGEFNVPYGGIAYNSKDFRKKVEYVFSDKVVNLIKGAKIKNRDFEEFLGSLELSQNDFVFLDPPYDTEFSDYDANPFTKKDQERLSKRLLGMDAKWILIIKETPFILDLYKNRNGVKILKFDKDYLFNIKDRNEREVKHLIIFNFDTNQSRLA